MPLAVTFPDSSAANPFAEQLAFFKQKLKLPSQRWDDILGAAHDRAFIVAGAAQADLVNDLYGAIAKAIESGKGLDAFRKDFNAIVLKNGWTGWTGEGSARGQAWRTRIIYQTNMSTSYAAGRYAQLTNPGLLAIRPYWRYVHADGVAHPRPLHLAWDGTVLPHDHPFWATHFAPNGWGCHCRITSADAGDYADAEEAGKGTPPTGWDNIDPQTGEPTGIDKGFGYAPGANTGTELAGFVGGKLATLEAPVGAAMYDAMQPVIQPQIDAAWNTFIEQVQANPGATGQQVTVGAIDPVTLDWLANNGLPQPGTAQIAAQDSLITGSSTAGGQQADKLTPEQLAAIPGMLANPGQVLYNSDTRRLVYVSNPDAQAAQFALELNYQTKQSGGVNLLVAALQVLQTDIAAAIAAGIYEVVK